MTEQSEEAAEAPLGPMCRLSQPGLFLTPTHTVGHLGAKSLRLAGRQSLPSAGVATPRAPPGR